MSNKIELKNNNKHVLTTMSKGLGNIHEHLEGCEFGMKCTMDSATFSKLNFHYIKDWCDYRINVTCDKEDPRYEDKFVY